MSIIRKKLGCGDDPPFTYRKYECHARQTQQQETASSRFGSRFRRQTLHKAQELFGYLEDDLLLFVSYKLKLPPSRVYGVATFYHFFTLKPKGEHTCVVCMGTACYVKGADKLIVAVQEDLKIKPGETTADNKVSLLTARCIGACGIAPAVVYDGTVTPRQTPAMTLEHIKKWGNK